MSDVSTAGGELWDAVGQLIRDADVPSLRAHKIGALAARLRRERGEPALPELDADERGAAVAMTLARSLLTQIRELHEGPLLVLKGPEVARLYPGAARAFSDVDILVPDAEALQRALVEAGYVEIDEPGMFPDHHHLRPLQPPAGAVKVEIHHGVFWPNRSARPFALEAALERAVPSRVGVAGVAAPAPVDHALILAAHSWGHEPLRVLRDLIDIAAVASLCDEDDLDAAARAAGLGRIWDTTRAATAALFDGSPPPAALRLWARHLPDVRERTVLESHVTRWLHPFWELPPHRAVLALRTPLRALVLPDRGVTWRVKLRRVRHALANPRARMSGHIRDASRKPD